MRIVTYLPAWPALVQSVAAHGTGHPAAGGWLGVVLIGIAVAVLIAGGLGGVLHRTVGGRRWVVLVLVGIAVLPLLAGGAVYVLDQARHSAGSRAGLLLLTVAVLLLVFAGGRAALARARYGRRRPRLLTLRRRLRWRLHPGPGFASSWALWRSLGLPAARQVARHARPSLSWLSRRLPGGWREYAAFNGWAHTGLRRHRVYSGVESMRLTIAAPQEGKSADAAGTILDAPGPVVATSIRGDLIAATAGLRSRHGWLSIWNPEGTGDYASTTGWNPVEGCGDMVTAVRRAGYMVEASTSRGLSDESFWRDQASLVLASMLHAAALAGGDLRHVHRWVLEDNAEPLRILSAHPGAAAQARSQAAQYRDLPSRTRAGVSATINNTLRFMQHPGIVASLLPAAGEGFDFRRFLSGRNTLYLVAADADTSPVSPLFVALCAEVTWHARQLGSVRRPSRPPRGRVLGSATLAGVADRLFPARTVSRLDPPLSMVLDEVANIAPVPAAAWATWAAGSGVWLHLYAQAWAQLAERWGDHGAAVIWQACKTKIVYTATSEPELCQMVQDLCGEVQVRGPDDWRPTRTGKARRRPTYETVPVLPHAELRQLPEGHAVVIQQSAPPAIVRTEKLWERADYKAWRRRHGPLALPVPPVREIPEPLPGLLTPPEQAPARPGPPGDELAARRRGGPAPGEQDPAPGPAGAPHWTSAVPEIPRELFVTPPAAEPGPPSKPRKTPRPPSRPAPWQPPDSGGEDR